MIRSYGSMLSTIKVMSGRISVDKKYPVSFSSKIILFDCRQKPDMQCCIYVLNAVRSTAAFNIAHEYACNVEY